MKHRVVSSIAALIVCAVAAPSLARGEVTKVTIASRTTVANGQPFGAVGPYEKLTGTIEFSLDPTNPHNKRIVDLNAAARGSDGRGVSSSKRMSRTLSSARRNTGTT